MTPRRRQPTIQDYAKILGHPLREAILRELAEADDNPKRLADALEPASLGTISYHVRELHELRAIGLVRSVPVRGALAHHYRITEVGSRALRVADYIRELK